MQELEKRKISFSFSCEICLPRLHLISSRICLTSNGERSRGVVVFNACWKPWTLVDRGILRFFIDEITECLDRDVCSRRIGCCCCCGIDFDLFADRIDARVKRRGFTFDFICDSLICLICSMKGGGRIERALQSSKFNWDIVLLSSNKSFNDGSISSSIKSLCVLGIPCKCLSNIYESSSERFCWCICDSLRNCWGEFARELADDESSYFDNWLFKISLRSSSSSLIFDLFETDKSERLVRIDTSLSHRFEQRSKFEIKKNQFSNNNFHRFYL